MVNSAMPPSTVKVRNGWPATASTITSHNQIAVATTRPSRAPSRSESCVRGMVVPHTSMFSSVAAVNRAIVVCERCPRLRAYGCRVARDKKREFSDWTYWGKPVPGWGDPAARLLVVGLAPAAHGANRTGRMFTGDSSGTRLYEALYRHGFASQPQSLSRDDGLTPNDCYIAAAARCAPPGNKPSRVELERCRPYLAAELRVLRRVRVAVTLGRIAHESWLKAAGWWERP